MFIGYFTERPYQDPNEGRLTNSIDLSVSNRLYNPNNAANLYHRYLDEKVYAEQMGYDGLMLNEHHSTPFCMGGVMNIEAAILARITSRAKIVLMGNILPIWDDPLFLAEELAMIDTISRGRLVTGWVRGTGRESISHNAASPYNWARFQEAHDFVVKAWTEPGPFRWEGEHYQFPYVNPWQRPFQKPHPPIWIPGVLSRNTVEWAAKHAYPNIMLSTELEATVKSFEYYHQVAAEYGHKTGSQNMGYLFRVHVDETEELAEATARKYLQGPSNVFLEGNQGQIQPFLQNLPGMTDQKNVLPTIENYAAAASRGRAQPNALDRVAIRDGNFEEQIQKMSIVAGTPKTVIPRLRYLLEKLRVGSLFLWNGDGAMSHDDAMRNIRLTGEEVIPALREIATELDLPGPFEVDPSTGKPVEEAAPAGAPVAS